MSRVFIMKLCVIYLVLISASSSLSAQDHAQHSHHHNHVDATNMQARQVAVNIDGHPRVISAQQGAWLELIIDGDPKEIYHLHGYNLMAAPRGVHQASITFLAEHTGRFPLVWHKNDPLLGSMEETIAYVEVRSH